MIRSHKSIYKAVDNETQQSVHQSIHIVKHNMQKKALKKKKIYTDTETLRLKVP